MTEEREQELKQMLEEVMVDLEIQSRYTHPPMPPMDVDKYKWHLQKSWTSYSPNSAWFLDQFKLEVNKDTKSKLLEFVRSELDSFICEDRILLGSFLLLSGLSDGVSLSQLLEKLLKVAIFGGIDRAVSAFGNCTTEDASISFEFIVLLEGITLEEEMQVFDGTRLVPLPTSSSVSELPRCLGSIGSTNLARFFKKTMLITDYSIFPPFHKPSVLDKTDIPNTLAESEKQRKKFQVEVKGGTLPDYTNTVFTEFHKKFFQALSLACNSAVKPAMSWNFLPEDELLNVNPGNTRYVISYSGPFGNSIEVEEAQINDAKRLYEILINMPPKIGKKLQIAIDRWIQSKANQTLEDKIIDLCIAFESLYLPGINDELKFRLSVRAAWFMGENGNDRKRLVTVFKKIYDCRSTIVHGGEFENGTVKIDRKTIPVSELIEDAQDLCQRSIVKILKKYSEDGEFPENDYWDSLILDEESS